MDEELSEIAWDESEEIEPESDPEDEDGYLIKMNLEDWTDKYGSIYG